MPGARVESSAEDLLSCERQAAINLGCVGIAHVAVWGRDYRDNTTLDAALDGVALLMNTPMTDARADMIADPTAFLRRLEGFGTTASYTRVNRETMQLLNNQLAHPDFPNDATCDVPALAHLGEFVRGMAKCAMLFEAECIASAASPDAVVARDLAPSLDSGEAPSGSDRAAPDAASHSKPHVPRLALSSAADVIHCATSTSSSVSFRSRSSSSRAAECDEAATSSPPASFLRRVSADLRRRCEASAERCRQRDMNDHPNEARFNSCRVTPMRKRPDGDKTPWSDLYDQGRAQQQLRLRRCAASREARLAAETASLQQPAQRLSLYDCGPKSRGSVTRQLAEALRLPLDAAGAQSLRPRLQQTVSAEQVNERVRWLSAFPRDPKQKESPLPRECTFKPQLSPSRTGSATRNGPSAVQRLYRDSSEWSARRRARAHEAASQEVQRVVQARLDADHHFRGRTQQDPALLCRFRDSVARTMADVA